THDRTATEIPKHHRLAASRVVRAPLKAYSQLDSTRRMEHRRWRRRLLRSLRAGALEAGDGPQGHTLGFAGTVNALSNELLTMTSALAATYGTPDLGNKADPVDELVYIILSRRTREGAYQAAFDALKSTYPRWEALAAAPIADIERIVGFSGLGR